MRFGLFIFILITASISFADSYRRLVNFEWEPIDGARSYEIEIRKRGETKKTTSFKTDSPEWNGRLQIGRYEFRLRALDRRQVPGDWSGYAELDVYLEPVRVASPNPQAQIKTASGDKTKVDFKWSPTPGASGYILEVFNEKNERVVEEKTTKESFSYEFPNAAVYTWKIKAISNEGLESETADTSKFTLVGPKLAKTDIEKPDHEFVRELKWSKVENAENYDVIVARYNPELKKWQKFKEFNDYKETQVNFESDWPGGKYRLIVKSKANKREESDLSSVSFGVRNGDRSPAAEYVNTMRKSIDRFNGWFAHASWYASSISLDSQYKGVLGFKTNAVTGTGRIGVGWVQPEKKWGFLGIADVGGYVFENNVYNFVGFEFSAIRKQDLTDRSDIRYHVGVFAKEFPALWTTSSSAIANFSNPNSVNRNYSKGGVIGPHVGAEYWYSMTPKLGLQMNAHLYIPMMGIQFPNGGKITDNSPNIAVGFLGSYRYSPKLTGLMGVNYRAESYTYTDTKDATAWATIYGNNVRDTVKTNITGIYINLMAEYSF